MSIVIGNFVNRIQKAIPDQLRNSKAWKIALSNAIKTGHDKEKERLDLILDWMWNVVLPQLNQVAIQGGYENEWQHMLREKSSTTAADASRAAVCVFYAGRVARNVSAVLQYADDAAADAAFEAADLAVNASLAVAHAARASRTDPANDAAAEAFWIKVDLVGLLERIYLLDSKMS